MNNFRSLARVIFLGVSLLLTTVYASEVNTGTTPTKPQSSQSASTDSKGSCCNYKTRYYCTVVSGGCKKCHKGCSTSVQVSEVASPSECENKGGTTTEVQTPASLIDNRTFNYIHYSTDYADSMATSDLGCGSCGSASIAKTSKTLSPLGLIRYHRFRNITEQSSFGGGVFSNWDVTLTLMKDANEKNLIDISNPNDLNTRRLFPQQGVFRDTFARSYDGMTLFKADGVTTTIDILQADTAELKTRSGRTFTFQLFNFDEVSKMGRLWKITDRNNYGFTIDYEIDDYAAYDPNDPSYDPYAKFRMESITDPNLRVMSFTYLQEGGVFVKRKGFYPIHTVTTPSGNVITYVYGSTTDSGLEAVNHADGTTSTFTTGTYDGQSYVHFFEASEHHNSKRKTVYLTDNFVGGVTSDGFEYYNSSSLLVNFATRGSLTVNEKNPTEEVTYIGMVDGHIMHRKIYEGGQRLKWLDIDIARYYKNWDLTGDSTTGADAFTGTKELTFEKGEFKFYAANRQGRPPIATDKQGVKNTFLYNANASMTKKNYPDGTFEEWDYNEFEQVVRYRDRLGRVTLNHYDERGNHLASVVGVEAVAATPGTERISGVVYNLYDGKWNQLPNFSALTPVDTGVTSLFEVDDTDRDHFYGMTFEGDLGITTAGDYVFTTGSDDGSKLYIDDVLVVDNDGSHALTEVDSALVTLTAGYHKIRVEFFERSGQQKLFVYYNGPDSGNLKTLIPDTALSHMNTGIQETDTLTAECAVIVKEYYPEGHDHQFLIKYEYDAFEFPNDGTAITNYTSLINYVKSNSTKRKEFQYNDDHQLAEIIEPDDEGTGYHTAWSFRYDTAKRLFKSIEAASSFVDEASDSPNRRYTARYYDNRDRLITLEYSDGSTETFTYGTGEDANQIVQQKDRNDNITTFIYDNCGRLDTVTKAANSSDPSVTKYSYLNGTDKKVSMEVNGDITEYGYDYRNRLVSTSIIVDDNSTLTTSSVYIDNKLFCQEDPYGRKTYYNYRSSDSALVRTIKGNYPSYTLTSFNDVASASRNFSDNSTHIITDYEKDVEGQTTEVTDGRGIKYNRFYNSRGWLIKEVSAAESIAATTEYDYDANGNQVEIRLPRFFDQTDIEGYLQSASRNLFSRRNNLIETTEAYYSTHTASRQFTYYNDGKLATSTDFKGNVTEQVYKICCGRLGVVAGPGFTDKDGDLKQRADIKQYDHFGNVTHTATLSWDAGTDLPPCCYPDPLDSATLTETTSAYDGRNRPVAMTRWLQKRQFVDRTNPEIASDKTLGLTTRTLYYDELNGHDELQPLLDKLSEDGISFTGNTGSAVVTINPENEVNIRIIDGAGRTVATGMIDKDTWAVGTMGTLVTWNTMIYDNIELTTGLLITETRSALDFSNKQFSDGSGRTIKVLDPKDKKSEYSYDNNNNRVLDKDPNNNGLNCTYDDLNRMTSCVDQRGHTKGAVYNLSNQVVQEIDGNNKFTLTSYDARNRPFSLKNRENKTRVIEYDANNQKIAEWNENQEAYVGLDYSKATRYLYDDRMVLTATALPGHPAGLEGNNYIDLTVAIGDADYDLAKCVTEAAGRLALCTDQNGNTVTNNFDLASRLISKEYHTGGTVLESTDEFSYDAASRQLTAYKKRYDNSIIYEYDKIGRKFKETIKLGRPEPAVSAQSFTTECSFDADNRKDTCEYPSGKLLDVDFDSRDQLEVIEFNAAPIATFMYDDGGREEKRTFGNGLATTSGYFKDNTRKSISTTDSTTAAIADISFAYTHDSNKNVLTESSTGAQMSAYSWTSTFDDIDRVENFSRNNSENQNWDMDAVGNWNSTSGQYGGNNFDEDRNGEHDDVNQILGFTPSGSPRVALDYDANGNLTQDEHGATLVWDIDNNLKSYTNGGLTVNFEYDAAGRRLVKEVIGGDKTYFIYHGQRVIEEYSETAGTYNLERSYVHGTYVDDILAKVEANSTPTILYYHSDRQFNVRGLSDAAGDVKELYAYSPFGKQTIISSTITSNNRYGFTGRYLDNETGLWYFRARYFSDELGRFISRDPLGYVDGMSLYNGYFAQGLNLDPHGTQTKRLSVAQLKARPKVQKALKEAWVKSKPYAPEVKQGKPGSQKKEHGGWILWNIEKNKIYIIELPPGTRDSLTNFRNYRPYEAPNKVIIVGWYHTHPNTDNEGYEAEPSLTDVLATYQHAKAHGLVMTHDGIKTIPYHPPKPKKGKGTPKQKSECDDYV